MFKVPLLDIIESRVITINLMGKVGTGEDLREVVKVVRGFYMLEE